MKIAALMLSGVAFYERARVAVETWAGDFDHLEIHSFTPCADMPIRVVGTREGPRSCFEKRLMGLEAACREVEADWYLACSDDNFYWKANLEAALEEQAMTSLAPEDCQKANELGCELTYEDAMETPMLVGGHSGLLKIADGTQVVYPSGGAGYVLNRAALELLVGEMAPLRSEWNRRSNHDDVEDVFMGWAAKEFSIPFLETPGFYGCNPLAGTCHSLPVERPISFHYVTAEDMRWLRALGPAPGVIAGELAKAV